MDLECNAIFISRNVVFHEEVFPLAGTKKSEDSLKLCTPLVHVPSGIQQSSFSSLPSQIFDLPPQISSHKKPPTHLSDYVCKNTQSHQKYPISSTISYSQISPSHMCYINNITKIHIPTNFPEAQGTKEWCEVVDVEIGAMESTNTWEITTLPKGKKAVGCKWVFTLKFLADGSLERYKARLVAKGYTQKEGLDYTNTLSLVAKMTTIKLLLKISASKKWFLKQLDVSNSFLNGELEEEIYMKLPEGSAEKKGIILPSNAVCRLKRSIYSLKQASRQWFKKFSASLLSLGFFKTHGDHTLFLIDCGGEYVVVLVYVDDIVIASTNEAAVVQLTQDLHNLFKLRDLGDLKYFLGLEISRTEVGISLCHRKYALELLASIGMINCKPVSVLMIPNVKLMKAS